jgi:diguanylate cyclase (GGDEF)-like protein
MLWWTLTEARERDEEATRRIRLFITLMVISIAIVIALTACFVAMGILGIFSPANAVIGGAFPFVFVPLSTYCIQRAKKGDLKFAIWLYVAVNTILISFAIWLFDGPLSPGWVLYTWTVTIAGTLLKPKYALWLSGGVVAYYLLLLACYLAGVYTPALTFGQPGRDLANMAFLLIMLVSTVGLLTYLNMRSLEEALGRLRVLSTIDQVTGAYNRRKFEERFTAEIECACRYRQPLTIIMFDIDHFKEANDKCGHTSGDRALAVVAQVVKQGLRETDALIRFGGDEFLVLLPQTELAGGVTLAEKLRTLIANQPLDACPNLTASFGVTAYQPGDSENSFVRRADVALYRAKGRGRNRVEQET